MNWTDLYSGSQQDRDLAHSTRWDELFLRDFKRQFSTLALAVAYDCEVFDTSMFQQLRQELMPDTVTQAKVFEVSPEWAQTRMQQNDRGTASRRCANILGNSSGSRRPAFPRVSHAGAGGMVLYQSRCFDNDAIIDTLPKDLIWLYNAAMENMDEWPDEIKFENGVPK